MQDGASEVRWAPRVAKRDVRRLYESEAKGLLDEDLLDEVGIALLLRCKSILDVKAAREGRVRCPRCGRDGRETIIDRVFAKREEERISCPECGWRTTWLAYSRTFKRRQLHSGGAVGAFERYVREYPLARTSGAKMLTVDRLIHEFHYSNHEAPDLPTRAACVNLIQGKLKDVVEFLDRLSAGTSRAQRTKSRWRAEARRTWLGDLELGGGA
ncbi:MAG: hypothetical protein ACYTKD_16310 [Planctomycetota bacterium]|jgi:DNA-directed RNA polymerase subunit RPC12/RpoP